MKEGIKSLQDLKALRDTALGEVGAADNSLEQSPERASAENKVVLSFEGKQLTPEQLRQLLTKEGTRLLKRIEFTIAKEQGMDADAVRKIGLQYGNIIRDLDSIENLKKQGRPFSNVQARVEKLIPSTITMTREQMAKRIVPKSEVTKETQPSATSETTVTVTSTETVTEKQTTLEAAVQIPSSDTPMRAGNHKEERVVHTDAVFVYPETNTYEQLNDLSKLTYEGLDMILGVPGGHESIKKELRTRLKDVLDGIPNTKKMAGELPPLHDAHTHLYWAEKNLLADRGHVSDRVSILSDIKEFNTSVATLAEAVHALPDDAREALKTKRAKISEPEVLPPLPRYSEKLDIASLTKNADAALTPPAAVEKRDIVSFTEMKQLVDTYNARIRNAARANPLAIITAEGSLYTTEYQPLLVTTKDLLKRLEERAGAAAEQDPALEAELATSLERLNELSSTIATNLLDKLPLRPVAAPSAEIVSPTLVVPPAAEVPLARVPGMQGPVQPSEAALQSAIKNGMEKGTLETTSALATLREKNETYKNARAAYEKAIDAHYGAYNSGTGTFWEKTRRGVGKFFGVGPKHTPELDALYHAMNDARVDFSKSRFEAMDARIKGRIAQNADGSEKLGKWNEGLKRREILRTIGRSSEDMLLRQKNALSPQQAESVSFVGKLLNKIPAQKRAQMVTIGTAVLGGALGAWKAKTAVATFGVSLVAAAFGVKAGNLAAGWVERRFNNDIQNALDTGGLGGMLDNADSRIAAKGAIHKPAITRDTTHLSSDFDFKDVATADAQNRERMSSVMGMEEAKKRAVGTVRVATAATVGMATGAIGSELVDMPASSLIYDLNKADVPEVPDTGGIEERGGGNGDGKTPNAVPVPESTPLHTEYKMVEGDNPWDLAEEKHFASKFEGMSNTERDHILDTVLDSLGKNAEMRQQVFPGYGSNDFTRMPIGQEVNLDIYEKLIDKEIERHGGDAPASPTAAPEPKIETPAPEAKPEPKIEDRLEQEEKRQDRGIETRTAVADAPRGLMNEEPSVNIDDRRSPAQVAADERMYRDLMSDNTSVADASYEGPSGLENEEPSTNVEDLRTPDGKTDFGLSESENSLVDVSTEVDNIIDPKLVTEQYEQIVRTLDGKRPDTGFFSSLLSTTVNERGAHDVLKNMTLGDIKTNLLNAPPQAWSTFAAQNSIDSASMTRWMEYLKQVSAADTAQDSSETLENYLRRISEHLLKTPKPTVA